MSSVDDLVAWLRVQLDEDERVARAVPPRFQLFDGTGIVVMHVFGGGTRSVTLPSSVARFAVRHDPARVLREVEAKRRILDALPSDDGYDAGRAKFSDYESCDDSCVGQVMHEVVKLLALPYADREGFREEWRP